MIVKAVTVVSAMETSSACPVATRAPMVVMAVSAETSSPCPSVAIAVTEVPAQTTLSNPFALPRAATAVSAETVLACPVVQPRLVTAVSAVIHSVCLYVLLHWDRFHLHLPAKRLQKAVGEKHPERCGGNPRGACRPIQTQHMACRIYQHDPRAL